MLELPLLNLIRLAEGDGDLEHLIVDVPTAVTSEADAAIVLIV
jgi:hypothetical protein